MSLLSSIQKCVAFALQGRNAIYLLAWGSHLLSYWRGFNNTLPVLGEWTDFIEFFLVIIPIILGAKIVLSKLKPFDLFFYFIVIIYFLSSFWFFPENSNELEKRMFNFIFLVVPYYFIGRSINIDKYILPFYILSVIIILCSVFYNIIFVQSLHYSGSAKILEDNMGASYRILPHVLLASWIALRKFNAASSLIMFVGVGMIMFFGTRGPLLCVIVFVSLYLVIFKAKRNKNIIRLFVVSIASLLLYFIDPIMRGLRLYAVSIGMSTRIFDKFLGGEIGHMSGRDVIADKLWNSMENDNYFWGHGFLGSYRIVDTYPHNIYLEFIYSFGFFIGYILLFILGCLISLALYIAKNSQIRIFIALLSCASVVKLFLSSTFLDEPLFFMLIGLCIQIIYTKGFGYRGVQINTTSNHNVSLT